MKLLRKVFFCLIYALPAVLFFSYYPLIALGRDTTMNFELSLPLIWLGIFAPVALLNLFFIAKAQPATSPQSSFFRQLPGISDRKFFLFALFPLYVTLSVFWSTNPIRTVLTAGVLWLTFFAVFAILSILPFCHPPQSFRPTLLKSILISTSIVCAFCWLQCFLDVAGVSRDTTLLCPGCTYYTFGFPHPSGFAIEPQFMGNLLLAPTLLVLFLLTYRNHSSTSAKHRQESSILESLQSVIPTKWLVSASLLFSATLFVTMSRGAIYAFLVALFMLLLFAIFQHQKWHLVIIVPLITFVISLLMQGVFSALSPTSDTFISGTTKVIHQLSLGIVDLRPQEPAENPVENSPTTPENDQKSENDQRSESSQQSPAEEESMFDGYVAASTNVRLGLNEVALRTWTSTPAQVIFGVGLGGAGVAMSRAFPEHELALPNAIVQNEAISLLLETGLVGVTLVLVALFLAFSPRSKFWHHPAMPLLVVLIVAYLITLNFFSGLPNALQIYLMPPLLYYLFQTSSMSSTSKLAKNSTNTPKIKKSSKKSSKKS